MFQRFNNYCELLDEYDGIYTQLVNEMSRQFNFSCKYLPYGTWGVALDNGTWTGGLVQDLQEGKIDVIGTNVFLIPEAYNLMDLGPALNKVWLYASIF